MKTLAIGLLLGVIYSVTMVTAFPPPHTCVDWHVGPMSQDGSPTDVIAPIVIVCDTWK